MAGEGGVQLISSTGGGGEIPKTPEAPNYVAMYNDSIRAALEPAKFSWDMYSKSEALGNQLKELNLKSDEIAETSRANQAREANEGLRLALGNREAAETERRNRADETIRNASATLETRRADETERHDKADELNASLREQNEQFKNILEGLKGDYYNAQTEHTRLETQKLQDDINDSKHDNLLLEELNKADFSPTEHYNVNENPALQDLYKKMTGPEGLKTDKGKAAFRDFMTSKQGLGRELSAYNEMSDWSPEVRDAFYSAYSQMPEGGSDEQRFFKAFDAGKQREADLKAQKNWTPAGWQTFNALRAAGKGWQESMVGGNEASVRESSLDKKSGADTANEIKIGPKQVDDAVDALIKQDKGESDDDFTRRKQSLKLWGYDHKNEFMTFMSAQPGVKEQNLNTFFKGAQQSGKQYQVAGLPDQTQTAKVAPTPPVIAKPSPTPDVSKAPPWPWSPAAHVTPSPTPGKGALSLPLSGQETELTSNQPGMTASPFEWLTNLSGQENATT